MLIVMNIASANADGTQPDAYVMGPSALVDGEFRSDSLCFLRGQELSWQVLRGCPKVVQHHGEPQVHIVKDLPRVGNLSTSRSVGSPP